MDADSLAQHIERDMEATSFPLSVTADRLEDGNETTGNQFQQPDWQVGEYIDCFGSALFFFSFLFLPEDLDPVDPGSMEEKFDKSNERQH